MSGRARPYGARGFVPCLVWALVVMLWGVSGGVAAGQVETPTATPLAPPGSSTPVVQPAEEPPLPTSGAPAATSLGTPAAAVLPPALAVEIDGWAFQMIRGESVTIYAREGVAQEALLRGWEAVQWAVLRVPEALGGPPMGSVDVYLMPSRDELHRILAEYAGAPPASVYPGLWAMSRTSNPHPGIYHDASSFGSVFMTTRMVAHEYAHQVVRSLAGPNPVPQWFNEAIAETVGVRAALERDPDLGDRRAFTTRAQLANAQAAGALPPLTSLVSATQWSNVAAATDLTYSLGWAAGERLAQARGSISFGRTLTLLSSGQSFDEAFQAVYDQPLEAFEGDLQGYLAELVTQFPSGVRVQRDPTALGDFVQFVFVGLQPSEAVAREYVGPRGCRASGRGSADGLGFHEFRFRVEASPACAGPWTVSVTGERGSQGAASFTLATP